MLLLLHIKSGTGETLGSFNCEVLQMKMKKTKYIICPLEQHIQVFSDLMLQSAEKPLHINVEK